MVTSGYFWDLNCLLAAMEEGGGSGYVAAFLTMSTIDVDDGVNGGGGRAAALLTMSMIDVDNGINGGGGGAAALLTM